MVFDAAGVQRQRGGEKVKIDGLHVRLRTDLVMSAHLPFFDKLKVITTSDIQKNQIIRNDV